MTTLRMRLTLRITAFLVMITALLSSQMMWIPTVQAGSSLASDSFAIVFVSRKIPPMGSVYMGASEAGSLPGVGPYSRLQVSAPGKLLVRESNGTIRTLVDGSNPTAVSLSLIDVNSPDVSYDGTKIVFAGLIKGTYDNSPLTNPGAWRIYTINVDGTGLKQVTVSDRDNLDLSQFKNVGELFKKYDDFDPAWLPDGRIVLSSTRWPSFGQYGGVRTSNLYVVNANGSNLHRITSERSGADRPQVDPVTGKIIYSRWWRNFRVATNDMSTIADPKGGYIQKDGLLNIIHSQPPPNDNEVGGFKNLERNAWQLATINPDGTHLAQWGGRSSSYFYGQIANHAYGGSFAADGSFFANFFPMNNMTEAAGFGGIRHYPRGPHGYTPIIGINVRNDSTQPLVKTTPPSYGIYEGNYAAEPEVLPDGRLVISLATSIAQDYGLYTLNADGTGLTSLYDNPGTTELRARVIRSRPLPPIIPDKITQVANLLPPLEQGPYDIDGTFTFQNLNVYFNAPVDTDILSAIPVGSANTIRFFIDQQRWQQNGSNESLDWPILMKELSVNPDGSITTSSPANVPLFEQIRSAKPGYQVPLTGNGSLSEEKGGAAHVAGMNFGRPGEVVTCVGCHAGHSMIPVPANPAEAQWTNLAPGATVSVSSLASGLSNGKGLIDRRVKMQVPATNASKYWQSASGQSPTAQWAQLTFPVPVTVRTVRLYNIPSSDSSIQVQAATVRLYSDAAGKNQVASNTSGALSVNGTDVSFSDIAATTVRIEFNAVNGNAAGLAEVEVIARAGGGSINPPTPIAVTPTLTTTPTALRVTPATATYTPTPTAINARTATPTYTFTPTAINPPPSTSTAISVPTSTPITFPSPTPLSTFTALPTNTTPPVSPTSAPNTLIIAPVLLNTDKGSVVGSVASLGVLKQGGTDDNPSEYVTFQTPGTATYVGYLTFKAPTNISPASVSGFSLRVNFKSNTSKQTWTWSIYDWTARQWVKLGSMSANTQDKWQMLKMSIPLLQQYASAGNEIRIQLRSNNNRGDAKIDYEVLEVILGSPASGQTLILPTPTTIVPSPTVTTPPILAPSPTMTMTVTAVEPSPTISSTPLIVESSPTSVP